MRKGEIVLGLICNSGEVRGLFYKNVSVHGVSRRGPSLDGPHRGPPRAHAHAVSRGPRVWPHGRIRCSFS